MSVQFGLGRTICYFLSGARCLRGLMQEMRFRDWLLTDPRELIVTGGHLAMQRILPMPCWPPPGNFSRTKTDFWRATRVCSALRARPMASARRQNRVFRDISLLFMAAAPQGQTAT